MEIFNFDGITPLRLLVDELLHMVSDVVSKFNREIRQIVWFCQLEPTKTRCHFLAYDRKAKKSHGRRKVSLQGAQNFTPISVEGEN